jgi:hypothetical protein
MRYAYKILAEKPKMKKPLETPWNKRKDNIKMDVRIQYWRAGTGFIWLRTGPVIGSCQHGNEPSLCHKRLDILD